MGIMSRVARELKKNYVLAKAEREGVGVSRAIRVKPLLEIMGWQATKKQPSANNLGPQKNILPVGPHIAIPTDASFKLSGQDYVYHTDGSLRHAGRGRKLTRTEKKSLKRQRQAARRVA